MPRKKNHKSRLYQPVREPGLGASLAHCDPEDSNMLRAASVAPQKHSILPFR